MKQYAESATVGGQYLRSYSSVGYASKEETETLPVLAPYEMELDEGIADGSTITAPTGVPHP